MCIAVNVILLCMPLNALLECVVIFDDESVSSCLRNINGRPALLGAAHILVLFTAGDA